MDGISFESSESIQLWKLLFNYNVYAGIASLALTTSCYWRKSSRKFIIVKEMKSTVLEKAYNQLSKFHNLRFLGSALTVATILDLVEYAPLAELTAMCAVLLYILPYLLKPSILRRDKSIGVNLTEEDLWRPISDPLVYTSLLYALPGLYALYYNMPFLGILHLYTSFGSTMFHLTRETMFFNWDNIGAMALMLIACFGFYLSLGTDMIWTAAAITGLPIGAFLLAYCGMPGELAEEKGVPPPGQPQAAPLGPGPGARPAPPAPPAAGKPAGPRTPLVPPAGGGGAWAAAPRARAPSHGLAAAVAEVAAAAALEEAGRAAGPAAAAAEAGWGGGGGGGDGRRVRVCDPRYPLWHTLWHWVSAAGTFLNVYFIVLHYPGLDGGAGSLPFFPELPAVPVTAIVAGAAINLIGNFAGVMPLR